MVRRKSLFAFNLLLVLALVAASLAEAKPAVNRTEESVESLANSDEDVDFPEDPGPEEKHAAAVRPAYLRSPVSVYVLRLLEILTGAETMGKHTRYARDSGDPYPDALPPPEGGRANTAASYTNYYDFLISEGSYKFWAAFQIGTAILLTYSAVAALYYARYTYYTNVDYSDYDDYFFKRSSRSRRSAPAKAPVKTLSGTEFQRVMDAVSGSKYAASSSSAARPRSSTTSS